MSIQPCEYEFEKRVRGEFAGVICILTGRGCYITDLLKVDNCHRRMWAKAYQAKQAGAQIGAPQAPVDQGLTQTAY
jgi:hypothetical protein